MHSYCASSSFSALVPSFIAEPQSSVVRAGSPITLTCAVQPETATIRWTVNGSVVTSQKRRIEVRDGNLRIASFNQPDGVSHEGVYQCVASSRLGSVVSREAKLEVASKKTFTSPA